MTIEDARGNVQQEKKILGDIQNILTQLNNADVAEKRFYYSTLNSLFAQIGMLNNALPNLIGEESPIKKLSQIQEKKKGMAKVSYQSQSSGEGSSVVLNKKEKEKFAKELSISEFNMKKTKIKPEIKKSWLGLSKISNKLFLSVSEKLAPNFSDLKKDLKEANISYLLTSYLSMALFVSLSLFILGILLTVVLFVLTSSLVWIWIPFFLLFLSIIGFYIYPSIEKGSVEKKINEELPFAAIYMAAIAGSNIEPTRIFKIISNSPEYPTVGREIKKVINQIEIYGYDLVTSLKNVAKMTSNKKLAELFGGMATNVLTGGSLRNYLDKRAENLLMDYRLERNKYISVAETFMDVYISILITAPLILMMLFVIMNLTGLGISLSLPALSLLSIGIVILVNIVFLIVLQIKQPRI